MAEMTPDAIEGAKPLAMQLMTIAMTYPPAEAIAALALALAGTVHAAHGDHVAVARMFVDAYRAITADMARKEREGQ